MEDAGEFCLICKEPRHNLQHNSTVNHRFYFIKKEYNENRKALIRNRHGVTLEAHVETMNNYVLNFECKPGKYVTKVTPEQLRRHNNSLTYNCVVNNTAQKKAIHLTNVELLHSSKYFNIVKSVKIGENENTFVKLYQGAEFKFKIIFKTDILTCASYKIPLICGFQTIGSENGKTNGGCQSFTIVRTFLIHIDDSIEEKREKIKSPFTSQSWKDIQVTIPTTKDHVYENKYPIPRKFMKLLAHSLEPFDNMTVQQEHDLEVLRQCIQRLTKENYNQFWHILLWLEEMGQSLKLMKYNMQEVTMEIYEKNLILEVPGLAERRPSVVVGDFIKMRLAGDHTVYNGFVERVKDKTIEISHVDQELIQCLRSDPLNPLDVAFVLGRLSFERMHSAVDRVVATGMVNNLFPPNAVLARSPTTLQLHDSQFINQTIRHNAEQRNAVNKIFTGVHSSPYIVFGPPGTGKTVTIVEAILQIKKRTKKKILVCAPVNSACDMLAMKLKQHCSKDELIRIHSGTRDRTTIPEELKEYSNIEDDQFVKIYPDKLKEYRIVVATLVLIGKYSDSYRPDYVFVDEAAQASEPEADIAIALATPGKRVVLAGDPKQLGPMTTAAAEKFGLATSLLERLMDCDVYKLNPRTKNYNSNFITMLKLNFRSHPDILSIPNKLFYDNLLKAVSLEAIRDPIVNIAIYPLINHQKRKGKAIEFCSISAKEQREGSSPSYFNLPEAKMVVKYVQALHNLDVPEASKIKEDQIGVVTPYKRQVFKIKEGLKYSGFPGVEVGTTENFQGREKRIIIISTVRAQHSLLLHDRNYNLGFVNHDQRFNVALTRAISKLIVIGNPLVLRTDSKWLKYMNLCEDQGTYFGNYFAKDDETFRKDVLYRMRRFKAKDDQYNRPL